MACMEHVCANPKCDFVWFNNGKAPSRCPECDGVKFISYSDEWIGVAETKALMDDTWEDAE